MSRKRLMLFTLGVVLALGATAGFHKIVSITSVFNRDGLKVLVADNFPKDTAVELDLGPQDRRLFRADGKDGKVESTLTYVNSDSFIVVKRKEIETEAFSMVFVTTMKDGRMLTLWDLNCDGEWDLRMGPRDNPQDKAYPWYIRVNNEWLRADRVDDVESAKPIALVMGAKYEFDSKWSKK